MGSIELKMSILTGAVAGLLLIVTELVIMHKKVSKYRDHLRGLYGSGRKLRLFVEVGGIVVVVLIQPVVISILTVMALGNFNPAFSANAAQQLKQGGQVEDRPLRSAHDNY
ncbi:MAG TPA: hypothetical protein VKG67_04620 [Gallionellaceae bacterium]|nr:hypothetical protein [Gallionellaceae bacterium]